MGATKVTERTPLVAIDKQTKFIICFQHLPGFLVFSFALSIILFWFTLMLNGILSKIHCPEFQVSSLSVHPFNVSVLDSQITANWDVGFIIRNPNKRFPISYDALDASVSFEKDFLSGVVIKPFDQKPKEQTVVNASIAASQVYVSNQVVKGIDEELTRTGAVNFNVTAQGRITVFGFMTTKNAIWVSCENLWVGLQSNSMAGTMLGDESKCKVEFQEIEYVG